MREFIFYVLLCFLILHFSYFFYSYLKNNYTTKKIKCLGQYQNERYLDILRELKKKRHSEQEISVENTHRNGNYISNKDKNQIETSLYQYVESVI